MEGTVKSIYGTGEGYTKKVELGLEIFLDALW
jgi:hypothetical protein